MRYHHSQKLRRLKSLDAANGGKLLRAGRMAEIVAATHKSERELRYRIAFAEKYNETQLCNALQSSPRANAPAIS